MPAKPAWLDQIDRVISELEASSRPFVDRATIETLLGVGRRRAQQILGPCVSYRVGASGVADRVRVVEHLRRLAAGEEAVYEVRRRNRVAGAIEELRRERMENPRLLVEAPVQVVSQALERLPPGVRVERGRITVEFSDPQQGLEKLLALAMAIGNDPERFEEWTRS